MPTKHTIANQMYAATSGGGNTSHAMFSDTAELVIISFHVGLLHGSISTNSYWLSQSHLLSDLTPCIQS